MSSQNVRIDLPDKFAELFESDYTPSGKRVRYRGAYGGRGSGKSIGYAKMALIKVMQSSNPFLCCRELQNSIKDSVHSLICDEIERMQLAMFFDVGESFIRCKISGGYFIFKGLRTNAAEIKSLNGVKYCWIEEAQSVSQKSLDILLPTIREDDSELWFSWNPYDETDPVHDMLVNKTPDNALVVKINYYDNPFFPNVLDQERLRVFNNQPEKYDWIWLGNFNKNAEESVYGKWIAKAEEEGRIKTGLYDPEHLVHTAWDLGYSDYTSIWWFQVIDGMVRLIDYHEDSRQGLKAYAEQIYGKEIHVSEYGEGGSVKAFKFGDVINEKRASYKYGEMFVPHDAASKFMQAYGRSTIDQLHEFGITPYLVKATTQQNQIDACRMMLNHAMIDKEGSGFGLVSLRKYKFLYDEDRKRYSNKPDHDIHSHACDAAEIVAMMWKSDKLEQKKAKPKFWNDMTVNELFYGQTNEPTGIDRL